MNIRAVQLKDAAEICRIYNYYIENTCVTFEMLPVTAEEIKGRIEKIVNESLPYYVAEVNGRIVGYAYIHFWHQRAAYSATKEITIYLDNEEKGKGYGSRLYSFFLEKIDQASTHSLIAAIALPNDGSVKLHEKFGFRQISYFKEVGYKFNAWQDVGHWQLIL